MFGTGTIKSIAGATLFHSENPDFNGYVPVVAGVHNDAIL